MRFVLTPVGSGGDVHPFVGIGRELRRRGHDVVLLSAAPFRDLAGAAGLTFRAVGSEEDYRRGLENPDLWHPRRGLGLVLGVVAEHLREAYGAIERLHVPGRTVLVGHALGFATRCFEETHGVPSATLHLAPSVFRSEHEQPYVAPGFDPTPWPRFAKRALWRLVDRFLIDPRIAPALNAFRAELGLPPVRGVFHGWLHSPNRVVALFPDWFGRPQPDWPPQTRLAGFPLWDAAVRHDLEPPLEAFLDAGEPPVAFTPGTGNAQALGFFRTAVEAAARAGRRALLVTPFREQVPRDLPVSVRHVPYAPFSLLLPRCAALVHHGGIGTAAQALAAGVPQLVRPIGFDQPDNGARLVRLGVARMLRPRAFTPSRVAAALGTLAADRAVAAACRRWRDAIRPGEGIPRAADLLEEVSRYRDR